MDSKKFKRKTVAKYGPTRIQYVPRPVSAGSHKVKPIVHKESSPFTTNTDQFNSKDTSPISTKRIETNQLATQTINDPTETSMTKRFVTANNNNNDNESKPSSNETPKKKEATQMEHRFKTYLKQLTPNQRLACILIIVMLILLILTAAIVPPVVLYASRQTSSESSLTNIIVSACSSSTCIGKETSYRSTIVTVFYQFDANTNDQTGYAKGTSYGTSSPSFTTQGYLCQAIVLQLNLQQYVQIPNVYLTQQSFTIETWLYPSLSVPTNDYAIFGQCDTNSKCMSISIRNARLTLSFDSMNNTNNTLMGDTLITANGWVHIAVVYDAVLFQQRIYVNGRIDGASHGMVYPYQGILSSSMITTIGKSSSFAYGNSYFDGRITYFTISAGVARSTCQILNDASLVVYYPFDTIDTLIDHNVNVCNGLTSGTKIISSGRVNQALLFTTNSSYFQSQCFPRMRSSDRSFSFSLWVNPTSSVSSGSLIHLSSNLYGNGTCYDLLTFTNTGALVYQWMSYWGTSVTSVQGPILPGNTWTHVAVIFSNTNGGRVFINGQFSFSTSNTGSISGHEFSIPMYITLGNMSPIGGSVSCINGSIPISPGPFSGAIDEFRLYNRELDSQEICVLANP